MVHILAHRHQIKLDAVEAKVNIFILVLVPSYNKNHDSFHITVYFKTVNGKHSFNLIFMIGLHLDWDLVSEKASPV